jgi:hypothetical protein
MTCNDNLIEKLSNNMDEDLPIINESSQVLFYKNKSFHQPFQYLL